MQDENRKTCIVTGAAGGIGTALVKTFHDAGYRVIGIDRVDSALAAEYGQHLKMDLARYAADEAYAETHTRQLREMLGGGGVDVLIHNAAVQILGHTDELTRADWLTTLQVNLLAPFLLTQALLPELEKTQGSVIQIGSIHARLTKARFVAYATSKAALAGMGKALAVDMGPRIRVNTIEPAAIETAMLREGFEGKPELYAQLEGCHPQQRIGQPEEVARLALAVSNGDLRFLHGATLQLDGGISARLHDPD